MRASWATSLEAVSNLLKEFTQWGPDRVRRVLFEAAEAALAIWPPPLAPSMDKSEVVDFMGAFMELQANGPIIEELDEIEEAVPVEAVSATPTPPPDPPPAKRSRTAHSLDLYPGAFFFGMFSGGPLLGCVLSEAIGEKRGTYRVQWAPERREGIWGKVRLASCAC